jgi:hypothetical protein
VLIVAGPCLGQVNTGIAIFEAPDQDTARRIVAGEPVTSGGYMRGDLRPYRLGLLTAAGQDPCGPYRLTRGGVPGYQARPRREAAVGVAQAQERHG